jgi:hypothetical protein
MLKTIELDSWSDFEEIIKAKLADEMLADEIHSYKLPSFFRGHSNAAWPLETTLERCVGKNQRVDMYFAVITNVLSEIETFTERKWELPNFEEFISNLDKTLVILDDRITNYMQYLRHFGYPSPLLDWSRSPFVAGYFAFRDVASKAESIAIYEYKRKDYETYSLSEAPHVYPVLTSSPGNKRHYLQQSVYTVCLGKTGNYVYYASHEDQSSPSGVSNEAMTKYILPACERVTALHRLEAYNINAYSLFGSEESLLESLFLRAYKTREKNKILFPSSNDDVAWW